MEAKALAWIAEKGGTLLEQKGCDPQYVWVRCGGAPPHEWRAALQNLAYSHSWCPRCYGNAPNTIEEMKAIALSRGGQCTSEVYKGLRCALNWKCMRGHSWPALPNNIKNHGSWCPHCRINVGEELTRLVMQEAFPGHEFGKTRAESWMEGLELDGFDEELRLAFEYQGKQHTSRVPHFQPSEADFTKQKERDLKKRLLCQEHEYTLLEVTHVTAFAKIRENVRDQLSDLGYPIAPIAYTDVELLDKIRVQGDHNEKQFMKAKAIIAQKGGTCVSTQYVSYNAPLSIVCGKGHPFLASLGAIDQPASRGPRFCPTCGGTAPKSESEIRTCMETRGYTYVGHRREKARLWITGVCSKGHPVDMLWDNFTATPPKNCETCGHARKGDHNRGDGAHWGEQYGLSLQDEYKNNTTKHLWRCSRSHEFNASLLDLQGKSSRSSPLCTSCELEDYAEKNGLTLASVWTDKCKPTTKIVFKCNGCQGPITTTKMSMARKKKLCPRCKTVVQE